MCTKAGSGKPHAEPVKGRSVKGWMLAVYLLAVCFPAVQAWPPYWWQDVHGYDGTSPWTSYMTYTAAFFGPNAFPVLETLDGRTSVNSRVDVSTDVFWGFGDQTQSLSMELQYAVWPGRVVVKGWGVLLEHYKTTLAVRDERASAVELAEETLLIGDLYLSTQVRLLEKKGHRPDLMVEWILKTASSGTPAGARFFDTPGYVGRLATGKSWYPRQAWLQEVRLAANVGFLSYQMNTRMQNDAPSAALQVSLRHEALSWTNEAAGYYGWTDRGDRPMVLRSKLSYDKGPLHVYVQYQHALHDYPFRRVQTGLGVDIPSIK